MADLVGQIGELRMTIEVKRAATGQTETYELIGTPLPQELDEPVDVKASQKDEGGA